MQLRARLSYAATKIEKDYWRLNSIEEAYGLAPCSPAKRSLLSPPSSRTPRRLWGVISPRGGGVVYRNHDGTPYHYHRQRSASVTGAGSASASARESSSRIQSLMDAVDVDVGNSSRLAPPADIIPRGSGPDGYSGPSLSLGSSLTPGTVYGGNSGNRPPPLQRTPSQNAAMEKDAIESLLFMSSSSSPPPQQLLSRNGYSNNHSNNNGNLSHFAPASASHTSPNGASISGYSPAPSSSMQATPILTAAATAGSQSNVIDRDGHKQMNRGSGWDSYRDGEPNGKRGQSQRLLQSQVVVERTPPPVFHGRPGGAGGAAGQGAGHKGNHRRHERRNLSISNAAELDEILSEMSDDESDEGDEDMGGFPPYVVQHSVQQVPTKE